MSEELKGLRTEAVGIYYWNANQCLVVIELIMQQAPRLRGDISSADLKQAEEEWVQMASFAMRHLSMFGMECLMKAFLLQLDLLDEESKKLETHHLGKLWNRLPLKIRVSWNNEWKAVTKGIGSSPLNLDQIVSRYSKSYKIARYSPHEFDTDEIDIFTFPHILRAGLTGFDSIVWG